MRSICTVLLLTLALECSAAPHPLVVWMTRFYRTRDMSRFDEYWSRSVGQGALHRDSYISEMTMGFLASVLRMYPQFVTDHIQAVSQFDEKDRDPIRIVLWLVDSERTRLILQVDGQSEMLKHRPPGIGQRQLLRPEDAEFLAGWFYASGDSQALTPMIGWVLRADEKSSPATIDGVAENLGDICELDSDVAGRVRALISAESTSAISRKILQKVINRKG